MTREGEESACAVLYLVLFGYVVLRHPIHYPVNCRDFRDALNFTSRPPAYVPREGLLGINPRKAKEHQETANKKTGLNPIAGVGDLKNTRIPRKV